MIQMTPEEMKFSAYLLPEFLLLFFRLKVQIVGPVGIGLAK